MVDPEELERVKDAYEQIDQRATDMGQQRAAFAFFLSSLFSGCGFFLFWYLTACGATFPTLAGSLASHGSSCVQRVSDEMPVCPTCPWNLRRRQRWQK